MIEKNNRRVHGGENMASAMLRFTAPYDRYAAQITDFFDRLYFDGKKDLYTEADGIVIHIFCRGVKFMSLTEAEIEAHRARSSTHFEEAVIAALKAEGFWEAKKMRTYVERLNEARSVQQLKE